MPPLEVARPVAFGVAIMLVVFLPILALEGVEGKLFRPMALTMIFALLGSLVLSLTLMPVLASLFLTKHVKETEPWLARMAHRVYAPVLGAAMRYRKLMLAGAVALLLGAGPSWPRVWAASSCPSSGKAPSSALLCAWRGFPSKRRWP